MVYKVVDCRAVADIQPLPDEELCGYCSLYWGLCYREDLFHPQRKCKSILTELHLVFIRLDVPRVGIRDEIRDTVQIFVF